MLPFCAGLRLACCLVECCGLMVFVATCFCWVGVWLWFDCGAINCFEGLFGKCLLLLGLV